MQLEIARKAEVDIYVLQDFGNANFGIPHTRAYLAGLKQAFKILSQWPHLGRVREEYGGTVRMHVYRSHLIFYRIEGDFLKVLRVTASRQDWPEAI